MNPKNQALLREVKKRSEEYRQVSANYYRRKLILPRALIVAACVGISLFVGPCMYLNSLSGWEEKAKKEKQEVINKADAKVETYLIQKNVFKKKFEDTESELEQLVTKRSSKEIRDYYKQEEKKLRAYYERQITNVRREKTNLETKVYDTNKENTALKQDLTTKERYYSELLRRSNALLREDGQKNIYVDWDFRYKKSNGQYKRISKYISKSEADKLNAVDVLIQSSCPNKRSNSYKRIKAATKDYTRLWVELLEKNNKLQYCLRIDKRSGNRCTDIKREDVINFIKHVLTNHYK